MSFTWTQPTERPKQVIMYSSAPAKGSLKRRKGFSCPKSKCLVFCKAFFLAKKKSRQCERLPYFPLQVSDMMEGAGHLLVLPNPNHLGTRLSTLQRMNLTIFDPPQPFAEIMIRFRLGFLSQQVIYRIILKKTREQ